MTEKTNIQTYKRYDQKSRIFKHNRKQKSFKYIRI